MAEDKNGSLDKSVMQDKKPGQELIHDYKKKIDTLIAV
jgi:hypothetical protein